MKRKVCMLLSALLIGGCAVFPAAADVTTDGTAPEQGIYCFSREELAEKSNLEGVYLLSLPARSSAELRLGNRSLRSGDVIPRSELTRILVEPHAGGEAVVRYLPVESGKIGEETVLTFHLEQTEDKPPVAEAGELETWRNLPNSGTLRATNDDDGALRFQLENHPRRGTVELNPDGSYTYTPKKNKVGEDSFTFTVTDEAGNVSAPATVRVTIRKPTDAQTFADLDRDAQFTALWLRETGLFGGELISDRLSFGPDRTVSRGEFLAMAMELEGIEPEIGLQTSGFCDEAEAAAWLRPYLASAMRRGLIDGEQSPAGLCFHPNEPITVRDAAILTAKLSGSEEALPVAMTDTPEALLTRQQSADLLYQLSKLN